MDDDLAHGLVCFHMFGCLDDILPIINTVDEDLEFAFRISKVVLDCVVVDFITKNRLVFKRAAS